ncbi:MAG: HAD family phosphatase [Clostridiales bacterium]|jgi:HAD superfamily hydrolase (TIGR01509 family)|nr:HAD family phosphatase [Clostridiales bacterium]
MKLKGAIFDLDGTLLDSMPFWDRVGAEYLRQKGHNPPDNINEILKVMDLSQSALYFKQEYSISGSPDEIVKEILELIEYQYRFTIPLKAGVIHFLDNLYNNGIRMCVATASDYDLTKAALERLNVAKYFKFILTCSQAELGKDNPGFFIKALELLQTPKYETIVFEDALYAIKSAKAAGLLVTAVYDESSHEDQEKIKSTADFYLDSFNVWKRMMIL